MFLYLPRAIFTNFNYWRNMNYTEQFMTKKNLLFIAIFTLVGFIALQIPVTQLEWSNAKFTVYDAFAPVAGFYRKRTRRYGSLPYAIFQFSYPRRAHCRCRNNYSFLSDTFCRVVFCKEKDIQCYHSDDRNRRVYSAPNRSRGLVLYAVLDNPNHLPFLA